MEQFNYVHSHENAGINALIAAAHPGGALLELGGGKHDRFASIHPDRRPLVVNVDQSPEGCYGNPLSIDLKSLQDGLRDTRIRDAVAPHGGIGTIVASHVCADIGPETVQAIIHSSVDSLLEGGNMWVVYLGRNNLRDLYIHALRDAMGTVRKVERLRGFEEDLKAMFESIDLIRGQCRVRCGALYPLARRDAEESRKQGWKPDQFFEKLWEWERRGSVKFLLEEGRRDECIGMVPLDAATTEWQKLSQQLLCVTKGTNGPLDEGWNALLGRRAQVMEGNRVWLKDKRKREKKR